MITPKEMSCLSLAFVGDAVYTLMVRERMARTGFPPGKLHDLSVNMVKAAAQAEACEIISPLLSEKEADILRRARNSHVGSLPKNATSRDYHAATSLEALFGWLWLNDEKTRANELFSIIWNKTIAEL